jgi:hypothetical protein
MTVDDDFLQHFPNVAAEPDANHSITIGERVRFQELLKALARARSVARRDHQGPVELLDRAERLAGGKALHAYYSKTYRLNAADFERDSAQAVASVKDAQLCIERVNEQYFTEPHRLRLAMTSDVESEQDPVELIRLCGMRGDDILSRRTRFEARRQLTLAQLCFEMRRNGDSPDELDRDMAEFDGELKRSYFHRGKSESVHIVAELDPESEYRVKRVETFRSPPPEQVGHSTASRIILHPDVRFLRLRRGDIPVYYETRVKRDATLKLFRKSQRITQTLTDLLGAKFVFFKEQDLLDGVDHMRHTIARVPGTVFGEKSNISEAGVLDHENESSASEFRAWKYILLLFGRWFELQFMLLKDWINERCSRGRENHVLYKLGSSLSKLFPKLFPSPFYLDWNDPELHAQLRRLQLAKIWS